MIPMKITDKSRYRMNIYISKELAKKVRIAALQAEKRVSEFVVDTLKDRVEDR